MDQKSMEFSKSGASLHLDLMRQPLHILFKNPLQVLLDHLTHTLLRKIESPYAKSAAQKAIPNREPPKNPLFPSLNLAGCHSY